MEIVIAVDDPRRDEVRAVLEAHVAFARRSTPARYSFALGLDELLAPRITFFSARRDKEVVGIAALERLDATHAELKSMHTRQAQRNQGVGRSMVEHILSFARRAGYRTVSLETGTADEFAPARALYGRCGFAPCGAFSDYLASPYNTFMTIGLGTEVAPTGSGTPPGIHRLGPVIETTRFCLVAGADEGSFLVADRDLQERFAYRQPGLLRRTTARGADGSWIVIDLWRSEADADACGRRRDGDPTVRRFMALVDPATMTTERFMPLPG